MKKTLVFAVGDQPEALLPALKEFSVEHAHLLTHPHYEPQAAQVREELERFRIPYSQRELTDNLWEDVFVRVAEFAQSYEKRSSIVVHAGVGDRVMQCASTAAAFVNGLQAVNGDGSAIFGLPVMRFEYYSAINERKKKILRSLEEGERSMKDVSESLSVSLSLLSYHVHGNRKSEGLVDMGLVELSECAGHTMLSLSSMGRLLLRGSIPEVKA